MTLLTAMSFKFSEKRGAEKYLFFCKKNAELFSDILKKIIVGEFEKNGEKLRSCQKRRTVNAIR